MQNCRLQDWDEPSTLPARACLTCAAIGPQGWVQSRPTSCLSSRDRGLFRAARFFRPALISAGSTLGSMSTRRPSTPYACETCYEWEHNRFEGWKWPSGEGQSTTKRISSALGFSLRCLDPAGVQRWRQLAIESSKLACEEVLHSCHQRRGGAMSQAQAESGRGRPAGSGIRSLLGVGSFTGLYRSLPAGAWASTTEGQEAQWSFL